MSHPSRISLSLRSAPAVQIDGSTFALQPVDAALLAWLALQGATPRARLAQLLWPDSDDTAARGALRQRLYKLRQLLGQDLVLGHQTLALAAGVVHDLEEADSLLAELRPVASGPFADWLAHERDRRALRRRSRLMQTVQDAESVSDYASALAQAQEWLQAEPEFEAAHQALIRLHYLLADRPAALAAYQRCEQMLQRTVGQAPSEATRALRDLLDAPVTSRATSARAATAALPPSLLRPPRLVGRDAEVAAALAAWAQGRVVALVAEAGMGKSRLLQHLAPLATGPGSAVLVAARPGDAAVPLSTLARLLRAMPRAAADVDASSRRALVSVVPDWDDEGEARGPVVTAVPGSRQTLQRAVHKLLAARATGGQLGLLAIDDLHFADAASLQLLQELLLEEPSSTVGLRWALGYRPAEVDGTLHQLHDALQEALRMQAVVLAPLDEPALAELVDSLGLPDLDGAALAPMLLRRTGGNPMFVLETLKLGVGAAAGVSGLGRPSSVTRLIERRLAQLSSAALALARCAAIAGTEFDIALATQVLQTPALALADAWAELEAAGVLRDQAFAHDLVYEATLATVPAPIARHLHGEVAQRLEERSGVAPATLARHWLAAGRPEHASPHLHQAADAAARAYDVVEAAKLWGQLADMQAAAGNGEAAFEAALAAANALRTQTTGAAIDAAIARLDRLARTASHRATICKQQAELCLAQGDVKGAAQCTARGLSLLDPNAPSAQRVALLNSLGVLQRRLGELANAQGTLEHALTLARSTSAQLAHPPAAGAAAADPDLPSVLNNLGLVLQEQDRHLEAIALMQEAAERQADPTTRARVLNNLAISLEERGQVQLAYEQRLAAARAVAGSHSLVEAMVCISLGAGARSLCRFREALAHLERAREVGEAHHRSDDLERQYAALWLQLGRVNLAREAMDRATAFAEGRADERYVNLVRARMAVQLHQPEQARRLLAPLKAHLESNGNQRALRRVWLVEAMVVPPDEACALMERALADPTAADNAGAALPLHVRLAQACLARGEQARALRAAERAADWLGAVQPLDMSPAEVWLTLARCREAQGESAPALQAAERGLAFVEQVALEHLDEMFREGWRRLNPVNADLHLLRARLATA